MTSTNKHINKQILRFYWREAWSYPWYAWGIVVIMPVTVFFHQFLPPLIAANILDKLSSRTFRPEQLWPEFGHSLVWYGLSTFAGAVLLWRLTILLNWGLENYVIRDITRKSFDHLMKLDADFHANHFGGSLVSQTNKLASAYVRIADAVQFQIYGLFISLVLTSILLWQRSLIFVGLMWVLAIAFIATALLLTKNVRSLSAKEAAAENKTTGRLADAITNVMAVKSFASSQRETKRFYAVTEETRLASRALMIGSTRKDFLFSSFTSTIGAVSMVMAVLSVVRFHSDISTVFLILTYTGNVAMKLWDLSTQALRNLNRGLGDAREGITTLTAEPAIQDPAEPEAPRMGNGAITFDHMNFTHAGNGEANALFQNFDLDIKPGEKVGLVGHSGSGKTSLTKLLLRYMDLDSGAILIDGQNIAHVKQDDLRDQIAYVPQEPLLFHRSIRENIAYGKPHATNAEIREAARNANAADFIDTLPDDYETLVGERGVKLSGGQRQRVAIARAMLRDAPILVLDEATSALDSESEVLIQQALWKLMEGRTAIVVAHRLSTIQKMDRIVVLEEGTIVEQGSHHQLLKQKGTYAKLWAHQSGGFIEE